VRQIEIGEKTIWKEHVGVDHAKEVSSHTSASRTGFICFLRTANLTWANMGSTLLRVPYWRRPRDASMISVSIDAETRRQDVRKWPGRSVESSSITKGRRSRVKSKPAEGIRHPAPCGPTRPTTRTTNSRFPVLLHGGTLHLRFHQRTDHIPCAGLLAAHPRPGPGSAKRRRYLR
jgi:hypothetical protein